MTVQAPQLHRVTLEAVDRAVNDWFDRTVDAHVQRPNGERYKVPVVMAAGERWVTARDSKGIRDKNGVLILPVISLRRSAVSPDPTMSPLGTETGNIQISRRISPKTNDLMNLNRDREPVHRIPAPVVHEVITIPFPSRSILTYELQIQTQYIVQMNSILEKMFNQLDLGRTFVAPLDNKGRHPPLGEELEKRAKEPSPSVVGFMESDLGDSGNMDEFTDQERIVRYSTQFRVPAVLQLDPEGEQPAVQVQRTTFLLKFGGEKVCFPRTRKEADDIFDP